MDSHGNSMSLSFHVSVIDGSLLEIDTKFHDYSMSFVQVLFVPHEKTLHGFGTSSSYGIAMVVNKKMMGFPSDLVSSSTKLLSKRHEKIRVTFFTGITITIKNKVIKLIVNDYSH